VSFHVPEMGNFPKMVSYLTYFPKVGLSDILPICVCVCVCAPPPPMAARQQSLIFDDRRDRPFIVGAQKKRGSGPPPPPAQTKRNIFCFENLPKTSGRTEKRTLSLTTKRV
jgi:hypothetical protein